MTLERMLGEVIVYLYFVRQVNLRLQVFKVWLVRFEQMDLLGHFSSEMLYLTVVINGANLPID